MDLSTTIYQTALKHLQGKHDQSSHGSWATGKRDITQTPEFKKWFGDSKVVDENGKPLVMYHGSFRSFEEFDKFMIGRGTDPGYFGAGFYFTPVEGLARYYGPNLYRVYLSIKNPYKTYNRKDLYDAAGTRQPLEIATWLKSKGYDGVLVENRSMLGVVNQFPFAEAVVFEPTQIKSTSNTTFDPKNPNILKELTVKHLGGQHDQKTHGSWASGRRDITQTPEFKRWFGNSKVVDENGKPLVVYHGGYIDNKHPVIAVFDEKTERGNLGIAYFSDDPEVASKYALGGGVSNLSIDQYIDYAELSDNRSSVVYPVYLKMERPVNLDQVTFDDVVSSISEKELTRSLSDFGMIEKFYAQYDELDKMGYDLPKYSDWYHDNLVDLITENYVPTIFGDDTFSLSGNKAASFLAEFALLPDFLKVRNADGLYYRDYESGGTTYIPFNANQIKSVHNQGTFDPANPNILKELTVKHLSGQHDQKLHGSWARGGEIRESSPLYARIKANQAANIPYEDLPSDMYTGMKELDNKVSSKTVDNYVSGLPPVGYNSMVPSDWTGKHYALQTLDTRSRVKEEIIDALEKESGLDYVEINRMVGAWAITSNDDSPLALGVQGKASFLFDIPLSDWQRKKYNEHYETPPGKRFVSIGKYLEATYKTTQKWFESKGYKPDDEITLFRGVDYDAVDGKIEKIGQKVDYLGNAMESWTICSRTASGFGGIVLSQKVKVKNIVSTGRTGFGCLGEGEMVVLGNSILGTQAQVVAAVGLTKGHE